MSRPREFDYDDVLHAAMDIFWEHGFTAASYDILAKGTKLKKQSLYGAFGDKKALFNKSLSLYNAEYLERFQESLGHGATASERLRYWQQHFLASHGKPHVGCMIVNSALELPDPEFGVVKAEFDHMNQRMKELFEAVISQGQREGTIIAKLSSERIAAHLVNTIIGLRVRVRAGESREQLQSHLDTALEMLFI